TEFAAAGGQQAQQAPDLVRCVLAASVLAAQVGEGVGPADAPRLGAERPVGDEPDGDLVPPQPGRGGELLLDPLRLGTRCRRRSAWARRAGGAAGPRPSSADRAAASSSGSSRRRRATGLLTRTVTGTSSSNSASSASATRAGKPAQYSLASAASERKRSRALS